VSLASFLFVYRTRHADIARSVFTSWPLADRSPFAIAGTHPGQPTLTPNASSYLTSVLRAFGQPASVIFKHPLTRCSFNSVLLHSTLTFPTFLSLLFQRIPPSLSGTSATSCPSGISKVSGDEILSSLTFIDGGIVVGRENSTALATTALKFPLYALPQNSQGAGMEKNHRGALPQILPLSHVSNIPPRMRTPPSEDVEADIARDDGRPEIKGKGPKMKNVNWKDNDKARNKNDKNNDAGVLSDSALVQVLNKEIRRSAYAHWPIDWERDGQAT
jgi:hypothetical protein